ncbi:copper homeostasis periplasmic binding protein CopC [Mesorhizobium sp. 128a]
MRTLLLPLAVSGLASVTFSGPAQAHAKLEASQPPIGSTVKEPPVEIDLTFSEELNLKFTGVKLLGPNNEEVKTDNPMLTNGDKEFMVSLPAGLGPGSYRVEWHAVSRDGHKTRGAYEFTVTPAPIKRASSD